jgi:hypothetical protein
VTLPAYGLVVLGVSEIVDVPVPPCDAIVIAALLLTLNVPGPAGFVTVTSTVVVGATLPAVPVTVTVYVPGVVVVVVVKVSEAVAAEPPLMVTDAGVAHVGGLIAPAGPPLIAQVSAIAPANPVDGVAVIVDVSVPPAAPIVTPVPESVKLGTVITGVTTCSPMVCTRCPVGSVPVTTTL